jgi:KDO2-lipid IV(A) lauroyltransferase
VLDFIASLVVRGLNLIFNLIPIGVGLWCGRAAGRIIFFLNRKRRLIAYANLKAALAKEKTPAQLKAILKRVYMNIAQTFVEVLNLTKVSRRYVDAYVKVINMDRMRNAAQSGRGVILLTAHFGNWELSSLVGAIVGFPMIVLAREQKMKRLNELLNRLRESKGCKVVRKGISVKFVFRALRNREIVGILADQDAGKRGVFVDFFGRPTSTAPGAFEFAKRTGAILLPNFIVRLKGPSHHLFLEDYIDVSSGDVKAAIQSYMSLVESYVRRYPDQWLWLHKRWKSTPLKKVLVLNDGRAGHLNQSMAVAYEIRRARESQGYKPGDTEIIIRDAKFKNDFSKFLLSVCSNFSSWRCHGCMRCLRFCLDEGSYASLMATYADFVISSGSNLAPVNVFMARENNAKNIVVMKQGNVRLSKFDLAIIPRHDRPGARGNVLVTDLVPNLIDEGRLRADGETLKKRLAMRDGVKVGLLIGGDNPDYILTEETIREVIDGTLKAAERLNAEILLTTSRRTPQAVERILKQKLSGNDRCGLLVIANEKNLDDAVGGILGLSDVILVSGESVSMVSEAVSSGKPVAVFRLKKTTTRRTKQELSLDGLEGLGYIEVIGSGEAGTTIEKLISGAQPLQRPKDMDNIYEAVRRLI